MLPILPADAIGGWLQRLSTMGERNGQLILLSYIKVQEWMAFFRPAARETKCCYSFRRSNRV